MIQPIVDAMTSLFFLIAEILLAGTLGFFMVYLAFLSIIALFARTRSSFNTVKLRRFAMIPE